MVGSTRINGCLDLFPVDTNMMHATRLPIYLELNTVGRLVAIHSGESRVAVPYPYYSPDGWGYPGNNKGS